MDISFSLAEAAWLILYGFVAGVFLGMRVQSIRRSRMGQRSEAAVAAGSIEIYVGNLAYDLSEKELHELFAHYGRVTSARVIMNKFNGKSKGYGFVTMDNATAAEEAIRALHGQDIKGRALVVNEAKAKARRDNR